MSHEIETMAYAFEGRADIPWHGLGNAVGRDLSVDEMLVAAGLDWTVEEVPAFVEHNGERIDLNRKAMIRSTDSKVLGIASKEWRPVQNREIMEFFRDYTEAGGATLETAGSLRGGKIVWALAKIAANFTVNGSDKTGGYVLLSGSHEAGRSTTARTTAIRVVCANTLAAAENDIATYKQTHSRDFDVEAARETIELANQAIVKMEIEANALLKLEMSTYDTVRQLAKYFAPMAVETPAEQEARIKEYLEDEATMPKKLREVMDSYHNAPGATPDTGWGIMNAVTHWSDHKAGRENDTRMFHSWLGGAAETKSKIYKDLLTLV